MQIVVINLLMKMRPNHLQLVHVGWILKVTRKYQGFSKLYLKMRDFVSVVGAMVQYCLGNGFTRGFFFCKSLVFFYLTRGFWYFNATGTMLYTTNTS